MKRFKLLKDLPFAKAGEELYLKFSEDSEFFLVYKGTDKAYTAELNPEFIDNFAEWFEEISEPEWAYHINDHGDSISCIRVGSLPSSERYLKEIGNYFETKEEAEKYLAYLKARAIIKQDTKGFKPNWKNCKNKYYGYWNSGENSLDYLVSYITKYSDICFKTEEDIEESLKKHPNEWRTYLTYEQ